MKDTIYDVLTKARQRSEGLTSCVDEHDLTAQHSRLMSPLVWDLAHIGNQEELWLLRAVGGQEPMHPEIDDLYDAFEHPRAERPALPLLSPAQSRRYIATVRDRAVDLRERVLGDCDAGLATKDVATRYRDSPAWARGGTEQLGPAANGTGEGRSYGTADPRRMQGQHAPLRLGQRSMSRRSAAGPA